MDSIFVNYKANFMGGRPGKIGQPDFFNHSWGLFIGYITLDNKDYRVLARPEIVENLIKELSNGVDNFLYICCKPKKPFKNKVLDGLTSLIF